MRKILWRASTIIWMILKVMRWSVRRVAIMLRLAHHTFQRCPTRPPRRHFQPLLTPPKRRSAMKITTREKLSNWTIRRIRHSMITLHRTLIHRSCQQHRHLIRVETMLSLLLTPSARRIAIMRAVLTLIVWRHRRRRRCRRSTAKTLVWHPNIIKNLIAFILISYTIIRIFTTRNRWVVSSPILMRWMLTTARWISIWRMESFQRESIRWKLNSTHRWQSYRQWVIMRVCWNITTRIRITLWVLEFIRCSIIMKLEEVMDRRQQFCHVWVIGIIMLKLNGISSRSVSIRFDCRKMKECSVNFILWKNKLYWILRIILSSCKIIFSFLTLWSRIVAMNFNTSTSNFSSSW